MGAVLLLVGSAGAQQYWGFITAETDCADNHVQLHFNFGYADDPPAEWVGWVVVRRVMGVCLDDVEITDVMPLPTEPGVVTVFDEPAIPPLPVMYTLMGVHADGTRELIIWPYHNHMVHAPCPGVPAIRGEVQIYGNNLVHVDVCPDECWAAKSFTENPLPPEYAGFEGQIVDVFGELIHGMHGFYMDVTDVQLSTVGCQSVPVNEATWSTVRGRFR